MGGSRIKKACEALKIFIKSLPVNCYFNVYSFGNQFEPMFISSVKNSQESNHSAVKQIEGMSANFGGTNILSPIEAALRSPLIEGHPKQIFLLTDGQVYNTEQIIEIIKQKVKFSRVHTIGIGDGASQALVTGCAKHGKGHSVFIKDSENPSSKIIQLLNDSLTPVISRVKLSYDHSLVESIVPNPAKIPYILKNQMVSFYLTFKGQLEKETCLSLEYEDSLNKLPFKGEVMVSP